MHLYTLIIYFLITSCQGEGKQKRIELPVEETTTYLDTIVLGEDKRILVVEFDAREPNKGRWGINKSGKHRIPFINSNYNSDTKKFTGDLSFFGNEVLGSISLEIKNNGAQGKFIWHKDTLNVNLNRVEDNLSYKEEDISFNNGTNVLKGTLILPKYGEAKSPVVVFISGSGCSTRWWGMYWANELSKIGVASLLYDKRGCGESTGTSWTNSSLNDLAEDVISGINLLEDHSGIDQNKIGLYGVSQGAWIASRVNGITGKNHFIIANSGGGVSPYEEEMFSYDLQMKFGGIDENGIEEGNTMVKQYLDYIATGKNRSDLEDAMRTNRDKKWFPILGLDKILVSEKNRADWKWIATYNPKEDIRKIKAPVLVMLGGQDHHQPTKISSRKWEEGLKEANNENFKIKIFEEAGHGLRVGGHDGQGFPNYAQGHIELMKEFIEKSVLKK
ncbi:alpha/beta hydrolase family protein [Flagellimonas meishanensis]|uniref:alpha/beta hydrolase family protein n=1 Tax=Flagellimonas meishanensis TaxID=2873264 RepID=UPI00223B574E|nr:alpha/beta hydrolase [[Muricauda] meishanensis]